MLNPRDFEVLFDTSPDPAHAGGWADGVLGQRTKTTKAGQIIFTESYPVWDTQHRADVQNEIEHRKTSRAQEQVNIRNRRRQLEIILNANFSENDLMLTLTYPEGHGPESTEQARKDAANYMRRLKRLRESLGMSPLKYVYVIEEQHPIGKPTRYHIHAIVNGGSPEYREQVEDKWITKHKGLVDAKRVQYQESGLSGYATYITKSIGREEKGDQTVSTSHAWYRSRNLRIPKPTTADKKISRRRAARMAMATEDEVKEAFARIYPGYRLIWYQIKESAFVSGIYIRAKLRKEE